MGNIININKTLCKKCNKTIKNRHMECGKCNAVFHVKCLQAEQVLKGNCPNCKNENVLFLNNSL